MRAAWVLLVVALALPARGESDPPAEADAESSSAESQDPPPPMTTPLWTPTPPALVHWHLLYLPEAAVSLAFAPVALLVRQVEVHRVDKRVVDLLESDDGRIKLRPKLKLSFGDGLGLGAELGLRGLFGRPARFDAGGIARLDSDFELAADYQQRFPRLEGRNVYLGVSFERDANQPFFGIGGDSAESDRRVLRSRDGGLRLGVDVNERGALPLSGLAQVGLLWQELGPGVDGARIPVGEMGDSVEAPPGFGEGLFYGSAGMTGSYDTRDVGGKPTRGFYAALSGEFRKSMAQSLSALKLGADLEWYVPILPHYRALVLSAGAGSAIGPVPGDAIPLAAYPFLGRRQHLRGYERVRFLDRHALWSGAEYRYPIYEYLNTSAGLDAVWFADLGTAFGEAPLDLASTRYSFGGGIRGSHETKLIFDMMIGWSPEGVELNLSAGSSL